MKKKFDLRQDVTNRIIERLENVGKFEMPFLKCGARNFKSGHIYTNINVILTALAGFGSPYWGTPKQWMEAGANIKGAKCTKIVAWVEKKKEDNENMKENSFWYPVYHNVLNSEQVTGWEAPKKENFGDAESISHVDKFFKNLGVETFYASGCACYTPSRDRIQQPPLGDFRATKTSTATECFYSTLGHENMHATMHKDRCDRDMESYAAEELVAEIGSAMLCGQLGISSEVRDDHVAYIKSWLKALKNDKTFIFAAAKESQKAVNWMNEQQEVKKKIAA